VLPILLKIVFFWQKILLNISIFVFKPFAPKEKKGIVVGIEEIASLLFSMGGALKGAKTVNFIKHPFYEQDYDYYFGRYKFFRRIRHVISPIVLGFLMVRYKTFIYISGNGYLIKHIDGRDYEFSKLQEYGCHIVCYFTGSDIRSFKLLNEFGKKHNMDVITTYLAMTNTGIESEPNESIRKMLGRSADKYASAIFNSSTDQMAYIERICNSFLYFVDEQKIKYLPKKFEQKKKVVLHAPSLPIIKGTPIVRAAVKQLFEEGYDFEYIELTGVSNIQVMAELEKAHIVLNEFYALVPGVFGIEAMMNNAVLLTSADEKLEPTLFQGANKAWIVTPYWRVYNNLKQALDSPMKSLQSQANIGTQWVEKYCTFSYSARYLQQVIDSFDD
jgi:hypothetical protein